MYTLMCNGMCSAITESLHALDASSAQQRVAVFPSRIDYRGRHTSFNLLTKVHSKETDADRRQYPLDSHNDNDDRHYFRVEAFGRRYILNVSESESFVSSDHVLEYHGDEGVRHVKASLQDNARCHLTGTVHEEGQLLEEGGWVAISNCRGLVRSSINPCSRCPYTKCAYLLILQQLISFTVYV